MSKSSAALLCSVLACAAGLFAPTADGQEPRPPQDAPVAARLLLPEAALVRGREHSLGLRLVLAEGWHVYWPGQNDSGLPVHLEPDLPAGFVLGEPAWPPPERYVGPGDLLDHVHHDALTLLFSLRVPEDAPLGEVTLRARVDWVVCLEACLIDGAEVELTLPVVDADAEPAPRPDDARLVQAARAALPSPLPEDVTLERADEDGDSVLLLTAPGARSLAFFPADDGLRLQDLLGTCISSGEVLRLRPHPRGRSDSRLRGVLSVLHEAGRPPAAYLLDLELP